ncbi:DUF1295 domain-containing protein [soil metagenome]
MTFAVLITAALAVVIVMTVAGVLAFRTHKAVWIDPAWGSAFALVAVLTAAVASFGDTDDGDPVRRWLVAALVAIWGGRLSWHLIGRVARADQDDARYEELLKGSIDEVPASRVIRKIFVLQGVLVLIISAPVLVGVLADTWSWAIAVLGVLVWALGFFFETVGDKQLRDYRADPDRGPIMDRGLWAWTRHPNYFGDACIWWGLWLVGGLAAGWVAGLATVIAPIAMTWFLTEVSGAKLLERRMGGRDGWAEYAAKTPMFIPRPPRS